MNLRRSGRFLLYLLLAGIAATAILGAVLYARIEPQLPSIEVLRDV